jgi:long-chain acyl-CoA synthetase
MNIDSLPAALKASAQRHGPHPAIVGAGPATDYATLDRLSDRAAAGLAARGIRKGDRIGLYCPNSAAFVTAYFAILKAGATVVPLNLLLNPKELAFILNDAGAKALIYHEAFSAGAQVLAPLTPQVALRACIGAQPAAAADANWTDLLAGPDSPPQINFQPADDVAVFLYTAGTTGFPKGAMLTHANLLANVDSIWEALHMEPSREIFLVVLPLFHAFAATASMLLPLFHGCTIIPVPHFEPVQVANAVQANRVTVFMAVPSMFNLLLRLPDSDAGKFASLKVCISGGAALPVEILNAFEKKFGKPIHEGDGPTECSPVTCVNPIGGRRKPGTVGLPIPRVAMSIRDENGRELPRNTVGEICVRGPNVMKGYWNRPDETRAAFFGDWFRTGDLGTVDADGYFSIVDRKKDLIIVNGMNVYPRVVEEVLYKFPPIREAAVVGEPHPLHGEVPIAYVSLKPGQTTTPEAVRAFCRDNLGRHEVPRKIVVLPDLPKNAAGKIMKRALRRQGEVERGVDSPKL